MTFLLLILPSLLVHPTLSCHTFLTLTSLCFLHPISPSLLTLLHSTTILTLFPSTPPLSPPLSPTPLHNTIILTLFSSTPLHYHLHSQPLHSTNILTFQHTTGRSFDAMGPKTTVENAKAPADWVTLKGVKEPVKKDEEAPVSIAERRRRRRTGGN